MPGGTVFYYQAISNKPPLRGSYYFSNLSKGGFITNHLVYGTLDSDKAADVPTVKKNAVVPVTEVVDGWLHHPNGHRGQRTFVVFNCYTINQ